MSAVWTVALSVIAHEIPQELADASLLRACGWSKRRCTLLNGLAASTVLLAPLCEIFWLRSEASLFGVRSKGIFCGLLLHMAMISMWLNGMSLLKSSTALTDAYGVHTYDSHTFGGHTDAYGQRHGHTDAYAHIDAHGYLNGIEDDEKYMKRAKSVFSLKNQLRVQTSIILWSVLGLFLSVYLHHSPVHTHPLTHHHHH